MESLAADEFDDIVAAAQRGEDWAFARIFRTYNARLTRYIRSCAPVDAEDIAAQTWLDATRSLERFTGNEDEFRGWLFTIARRRVVDARRRSRRRVVAEVDVDDVPDGPSVASAESDAIDQMAGERAARRVAALLPPELAEIVLLRVVGGLSVDEVARITGRPPGTVRVLQHRALRRLARRLPDGF